MCATKLWSIKGRYDGDKQNGGVEKGRRNSCVNIFSVSVGNRKLTMYLRLPHVNLLYVSLFAKGVNFGISGKFVYESRV